MEHVNILAPPQPNFGNHEIARGRVRRHQAQLLDHDLNEVEARIGERMRRMEQRRGEGSMIRQPRRLANQQTNLPDPRLVGIIRRMEELGIELPGPEPPMNAGPERIEWEARFEEYKRRIEEHGIIDIDRYVPLDNARQEVDGHQDQEIRFHVRLVEESGFQILPETRRPDTAHEHEEILGRRAANRRQVALRERELYTSLLARGVHLPQSENPMDELLDHRQDQALFEWLQRYDAFRGLALNESYRLERGNLRTAHTRTNREIYDMLRDCGVFWEINNDRNGRWRTRERYLFDEVEEDLSDTFDELLHEGAFAGPPIRRMFPERNEYAIFRAVLEMRASWDSRRRRWQRRSSLTGRLVEVE